MLFGVIFTSTSFLLTPGISAVILYPFPLSIISIAVILVSVSSQVSLGIKPPHRFLRQNGVHGSSQKNLSIASIILNGFHIVGAVVFSVVDSFPFFELIFIFLSFFFTIFYPSPYIFKIKCIILFFPLVLHSNKV